jgi:hypothetical protein
MLTNYKLAVIAVVCGSAFRSPQDAVSFVGTWTAEAQDSNANQG